MMSFEGISRGSVQGVLVASRALSILRHLLAHVSPGARETAGNDTFQALARAGPSNGLLNDAPDLSAKILRWLTRNSPLKSSTLTSVDASRIFVL